MTGAGALVVIVRCGVRRGRKGCTLATVHATPDGLLLRVDTPQSPLVGLLPHTGTLLLTGEHLPAYLSPYAWPLPAAGVSTCRCPRVEWLVPSPREIREIAEGWRPGDEPRLRIAERAALLPEYYAGRRPAHRSA